MSGRPSAVGMKTVFGLLANSVILRLVRRPYGLHAIPAMIQTHASQKARGPIAKITGAAGATRTGRKSLARDMVRRPYGLHAIPAMIQTHASQKARGPTAKITGAAGATRTGRKSRARLSHAYRARGARHVKERSKKRQNPAEAGFCLKIGWQRPTLPQPHGCSTIGAEELSFRVRDGIGRTLLAIVTNQSVPSQLTRQ